MLCYSTGSLPSVSFAEMAQILANTSFKGVELVLTPQMLKKSTTAHYWKDVRETFEEHSLVLRNIHLGAPFLASPVAHEPGLSSPISKERQTKLDATLQSIEIAYHAEVPRVTVTSGLPKEEGMLRRQEEFFYESVHTLMTKLPQEIELGLEQEPEHVIHSTEQLQALCQEFPTMGLNFDVGHSEVLGEDIPQCLEVLFPNLYNIHFEDIANNIHQHKLFGDGDIDFTPIFNLLKKKGYTGDMTPDLYPFTEEYDKAIQSSENFFKQHL
jgi:sugar phosphate isomerase/epimerase